MSQMSVLFFCKFSTALMLLFILVTEQLFWISQRLKGHFTTFTADDLICSQRSHRSASELIVIIS